MSHETTLPFGNPDGAKAEIEDILEGFVEFGENIAGEGLATKNDDLRSRVIVGRKGSGKTVYLRRLQDSASKNDSIYSSKTMFGGDLMQTSEIIRFNNIFNKKTDSISELWTKIWRTAILRTLVSYLLKDNKLSNYLTEIEKNLLTFNYPELYPEFGTRLSVYSQVSEIINSYTSRNRVVDYLAHRKWAELEKNIEDILQHCPPICFYIDGVDDHFAHAPTHWLICQKGLFYQTMKFLEQPHFSRLHVIISLRDIVFSSVLRSEHVGRYKNEPHIKLLKWNKQAISYFLEKKIQTLDDSFFIGDVNNGKTLINLLGISHIENTSLGISEEIENYVLRHSMLLPRNIVDMGNKLCKAVQNYKKNNHMTTIEELVRNAVSESARDVGNEQLNICANQLLANSMPLSAGSWGISNLYTTSEFMLDTFVEDLKGLLVAIKYNKFDQRVLNLLKKAAKSKWNGQDHNLLTVLWQNGLLGFVDSKSKTRFFSENELQDFKVPKGKITYVFHSCLIDTVGVTPVDNEPVLNF
jgi:hypothetical protein